MREFPVFVPHGDEGLAAILAIPDGGPRGLVVLSTGVGASRSHRFQVWARLAERLSALGIASIRYEYLGMHDSTGTITSAELEATPIDQLRSVSQFAKEALGVRRLVAVGNCYGGHGSLHLAAEDADCLGAACILPRTVRPGGISVLIRTVAQGRAGDFIRKRPRLRALARPLRRLNLRLRAHTKDALPKALQHARVVFLVDQDHLRRMGRFDQLNGVLDKLPAEQRERFELRVVAGAGLDRFGSLEAQQAVLDVLPTWIAQRFDEASLPVV